MARNNVELEPLLTPAEVAALFGVDTATVTRWARSGRLRPVRTLGGHRRYREREVRSLLPPTGSRPDWSSATANGARTQRDSRR